LHDVKSERRGAALNVAACRAQFPALAREIAGRLAVYFDGPAGSQVPERVINAISSYLKTHNANHGGLFATSRESDAMLASAHEAVADLLGTADPQLTVFGANMTTLTFALSRALAKSWRPGDEIIVTRLDHDANVTPWVLAARDAGATIRHLGIRADDCTLDLDELAALISPSTRLVAVGCASNAVGTVNPMGKVVEMAHAAGAQVFLDAVHYAPHRLIDVDSWGCDFLVCSAYKFFGPHVGILWGRRELLASLPAYKVRPAADSLPDRWMTGTQNHESIAGVLAAIEYLADLGRAAEPATMSRRGALAAAFAAIGEYEMLLAARLLSGLAETPRIRVWGIAGTARLDERVPTVGITHESLGATELASRLGEQGIFVWHGNFYALPLTEALGLEPDGLVRIGLLHYNTPEEVDRLLAALAAME
jgi:cysteine desulfurase family protein (TIGR01976 family)